jgi:hypothetical protein
MKPQAVVGQDSWRKWVLGILALLLADHLGVMELHGLSDRYLPADSHEAIALIAAAGAAISSFRK